MAGRVHVSRKAAGLIKDQCSDLRIEERGEIDIKGKGKVRSTCVSVRGMVFVRVVVTLCVGVDP
jgi:hypothetical protein